MQSTTESFEKALADVFEGREVQFSYSTRKLLQDFYERALQDGVSPRKKASAPLSHTAKTPISLGTVKVGDRIQNSYLKHQGRYREVLGVQPTFITTQLKESNGKAVETSKRVDDNYLASFGPYYKI